MTQADKAMIRWLLRLRAAVTIALATEDGRRVRKLATRRENISFMEAVAADLRGCADVLDAAAARLRAAQALAVAGRSLRKAT